MPQWLGDLIQQFQALPTPRKLVLAGTAAGSLLFFLFVASGASRSDYKLLYRGLDEAEAAQVIDALTAERIDYRLEEGGSAVLVPGAMVYEARIRVAGKGLPSGASPGFEIFDNGAFGVTDFVQKVNYRRALQGELARSIEQLEPVEKARVQIAIPEQSVFVRRERSRPTASVVLRLRGGREIAEEQAEGIVHLVASSVAGLDPAAITVVDNHGRVLAPQGDGTPGPRAPAGALAQQQRIEHQLEERIESILERTVGIGRVAARVSAELDWTQTETTEERFDPDSQVARSEQRSTETSNDRDELNGGPAGVIANSPDALVEQETGGRSTSSSRTAETINYEISKLVSRQVAPLGSLQRLSVAVLVDGRLPGAAPVGDEAQPSEEGGVDADAFQPWSESELQQFEELAKRAVGFDPERGDEISVINAPFRSIDLEVDDGSWLEPQVLLLITSVLRWLGLALALLLFARLLVKPLADALQSEEPALVGMRAGQLAGELSASGAPRTPAGENDPFAELESMVADEQREVTLADKVNFLTERRRDDSVKTIRGWLGS